MTTIYVDNSPPQYKDQLKQQIKEIPTDIKNYIKNLFPIVNWLPHYNWIWLSGDLTAAITVGTLVIPQSLAYAKIANLPPVFGLYTSFVGVILYPLFGTSKDVSIGVSAITSLMVGQVIDKFLLSAQYLSGEWTMAQVAINLSLISGFAIFAIGLFRLGAIYNFISQPAIAGFMAGSGLTIVINQFSKIFGVPNINTSQAPYLVFGKTLINLHHSTIDAAFGVSALIWLYGVKYLSQHLLRKYPQHGRLLFFFNTSRSIVVLVFGTLVCFMINRFGHFEKSPINIIGVIPAGFGHMNVPTVNTSLIGFFGTDFIGIVVLIIMEHGAIAHSLGKVSDYKVTMSNELFATGIANIFGSFFCSYPGTGAFSRTAVMSKSGARTPLTSFFVGIIVVLAIYVFTPAFTYIPNASLAAIIAHSVTDLISGPSVWKKFWDLNLTEILIFTLAYIIALVAPIDIGVYVPVVISIVVQWYRIFRPQYAVLGRMDMVDPGTGFLDEKKHFEKKGESQIDDEESLYAAANSLNHTLFSPLDHPTLGKYTHPIDNDIICFQPRESIVFQNASYITEKLLDEIKFKTRRGKPPAEKVGDRAWNNAESMGKNQERPLLRAVVLDLSGVHQMDYTGMEALRDVAVATERYTGRHVHWYIVTGESATVRKSLLFAGFGNQRRNLKLPGQYLSDLLNGVEEGGHTPGILGCCSFNISKEEADQELQDEVDEKNSHHITAHSFDQIVTIEQARRPSRHLTDQQSMETLETAASDVIIDDNAPTSTSESAQWCYCNIRSNPMNSNSYNNGISEGIVAVHDVFPFFFRSLHDAVKTALLRKQSEELYDQQLEQISIISDRGIERITDSPATRVAEQGSSRTTTSITAS